ncbi:unnamed protein product [Adineta ricciae]|uniref:Uncharacterized protein n=1 Tax=Adineta ricciae TaxID=249248 RepID=A0A815E1Q2_ADIRI|nr:unnamed protein product [Adineta ricciae]CAF1431205.1 unnamed protein product [Adineta ricciae]
MASNCDCIEPILDAVDVVKSDANETTTEVAIDESASNDAPNVPDTIDIVKFDTNETTTAVAVDESTSNNTPNTSDTISQIKKQVTDEYSTAPKNHSRGQNTHRYTSLANNLASSTMTLVIQRSKPLILKLRNPEYTWSCNAIKPQGNIESTTNSLGNELVAHVTATVNSIRNEVKSARPQPDEENYELKMAAYLEFVKCITHMINSLTGVFDDFLTEYRRLIDQLWDHLQQCAHPDTDRFIQQFLSQVEKIFRDAVTNKIELLFKAIDSKFNPSEQ